MIKNAKQTKVRVSWDTNRFQLLKRQSTVSKPLQLIPVVKSKFILPKGEETYYNECFPEEFTVYSLNNRLNNYAEFKEISQKTKATKKICDVIEITSEEQSLIYTPIKSIRRERIFEDRSISKSPLSKSLFSGHLKYKYE